MDYLDYFPTKESLLTGLNAWMENHRLTDFKNQVYPQFVAKCKEFNIEEISYDQANKLKNGQTKGLEYGQLRALIAALNIDNWHKFLDLCHPPTIEDVRPIRPSDCETRHINSVKKRQDIPVACIHPDKLGRIRTRVDMVDMEKGQSTGFEPHFGHEFVHVLHGRVTCKFSDGKKKLTMTLVGSDVKKRPRDAYYAVAFAAGLHHSFTCLTNVRMAVGRSAKSLPKGIK